MLGGGEQARATRSLYRLKRVSFQGVSMVRGARSLDNETQPLWLNTFLLRPYHNFKINMSHLIPEIKDRDMLCY